MPTFLPDAVMDESVDLIMRGEGELSLVRLMEALTHGGNTEDIQGVLSRNGSGTYRGNGFGYVKDIDALPFPDREILYGHYRFFRRYPLRGVIAARGCPYRCTFCYVGDLGRMGGGNPLRIRGIHGLIQELKCIRERYRGKAVQFVDDRFPLKGEWFEGFIENYTKEVGSPFIVSVMANELDEERIRGLKKAGCITVQMGLECGDEAYRRDILKKPVNNWAFKDTACLLRKYGISITTYVMLGLPGETIDKAWDTVDLVSEIGADIPKSSIYQPFPGTVLARYCVEKGLLKREPEAADFSSLAMYKGSPLHQPDIKALINLHKLFFYAVRIPRLKKIIRLLLKAPPNPLYDLLYLVSLGLIYMRIFKWRLVDAARIYIKNLRLFFR